MESETEITKDPPKKKGLMRMIELIDRDTPNFLRSGFLAFAGLLPYIAAIAAAVAYASPLLLLLCIPAGMLAAPEIFAAADTVMRSQREEVGWWWWDSYRTAWKRDLKASLLPGAVFGLLVGLQIFALYIVSRLPDPAAEFWLLTGASAIGFGILGYYLPMAVCMELSFPALLRNCFLLFFLHPVKSLKSALVHILYYGAILMWFPLTMVAFVMFSVWLPLVMSCVILYPVLDKHLELEASYEKLRKARWEGGESEEEPHAVSDQ